MIDKASLKSTNGIPLTQSLFLEIGYTEYSVFTLKDDDYEYKGKVYPSLKKLYLEMEDVGEYLFACEYLLGWEHWQRLCSNKQISKEIEKWRYELELKLRSKAIIEIRNRSKTEKGINASKWLAEKGWDKRQAGRPSKEEVERETKVAADLNRMFADDLQNLGSM